MVNELFLKDLSLTVPPTALPPPHIDGLIASRIGELLAVVSPLFSGGTGGTVTIVRWMPGSEEADSSAISAPGQGAPALASASIPLTASAPPPPPGAACGVLKGSAGAENAESLAISPTLRAPDAARASRCHLAHGADVEAAGGLATHAAAPVSCSAQCGAESCFVRRGGERRTRIRRLAAADGLPLEVSASSLLGPSSMSIRVHVEAEPEDDEWEELEEPGLAAGGYKLQRPTSLEGFVHSIDGN